jgi:hypothetical protein
MVLITMINATFCVQNGAQNCRADSSSLQNLLTDIFMGNEVSLRFCIYNFSLKCLD